MAANVSHNPDAADGQTRPTSASEEVDTNDLGFLSGLTSAPCFRDTALYSIGGSAALAALHLHRNRKAGEASSL